MSKSVYLHCCRRTYELTCHKEWQRTALLPLLGVTFGLQRPLAVMLTCSCSSDLLVDKAVWSFFWQLPQIFIAPQHARRFLLLRRRSLNDWSFRRSPDIQKNKVAALPIEEYSSTCLADLLLNLRIFFTNEERRC